MCEIKYVIFVLCVTVCCGAVGDDTAFCNEERCINTETNTIWGLGVSFTPVYKNQYQINLLKMSESCEDKKISEDKKIKLPKNSYFKETLDKESQNSNEIIVHVYELDKNEKKEQDVINEYFSSPYKVCLNGKHRVQKSLYTRVGGVNTGVLVVPFKLRDGNVYSDSTIGPYLSYKWEVFEVLATAGLSQISTSEVGTEGVKNETGLTGAIGLTFKIDTNWDVAFLAGKDYLSGDKGNDWEYQGETWFSFGIGFNFTR